MPALKLDRVWTREEVLALPDDGNRYELVDGELLVSPSPRLLHQRAVMELAVLIHRYITENGIGWMCAGPSDLDLRARQRVQPDLFVAAGTGRHLREWTDVGVPLLVVEVLSPKTADFDRVKKRRRYQRSGVPQYWIVDLAARRFEVWTPRARKPAIETERVSWQPVATIAPLVIELDQFFAEDFGPE